MKYNQILFLFGIFVQLLVRNTPPHFALGQDHTPVHIDFVHGDLVLLPVDSEFISFAQFLVLDISSILEYLLGLNILASESRL